MAEGVRIGVNGTPTFIIDGERFDGRLARHRAARGGDRGNGRKLDAGRGTL